MKTMYPAVFHTEGQGFWVEFPDLPGCYSDGDTISEALDNAKEALACFCVQLLEEKTALPKASNIKDLSVAEDSFSSLVETELIPKSKAVKKTLTIPSWLNEIAEERGVNFSNTLQNALVKELNLV